MTLIVPQLLLLLLLLLQQLLLLRSPMPVFAQLHRPHLSFKRSLEIPKQQYQPTTVVFCLS
jgi:hypothetical protein